MYELVLLLSAWTSIKAMRSCEERQLILSRLDLTHVPVLGSSDDASACIPPIVLGVANHFSRITGHIDARRGADPGRLFHPR